MRLGPDFAHTVAGLTGLIAGMAVQRLHPGRRDHTRRAGASPAGVLEQGRPLLVMATSGLLMAMTAEVF